MDETEDEDDRHDEDDDDDLHRVQHGVVPPVFVGLAVYHLTKSSISPIFVSFAPFH